MWEVTDLKDKITTALIALPVSWLLGWVWLLCALTGCVLFSFHTGTLLGVSCSIAAVYWLWNAWGISKPIRALITRLSVIYDSAYHWGVLEFAGIDWQTTSLDLLLMAWGGVIALAAAAAIVRGRGGIAAAGIAVPPLILTMVVTDTPPDALPLGGFILSVILLMMTRSVARQNPRQGARLAALTAVPAALLLTALFTAYPQDTYVNRAQEQLDTIVAWWQDAIVSPFRGGSNLGQTMNPTPTSSASTRLGSLGPRRVTAYKVMEVTADFDGTLYLRGQDYDAYDGLSWTSTADRGESLTKSPQSTHRGTVTVKTLRPMELVYIPGYPSRDYILYDGRMENTDEQTEFTWSVSKIPMLPDRFSTQYTDTSSLAPYLELPQSTWAWADDYLGQILKDGGLYGTDLNYSMNTEIARIIINHVASSARYSLNTSRMDSESDDFARWFLEESDTGYCVHFATAATVLLRAAGVPARYVTGYMVSCEAGKTVTVESDRAHAWVEYYDDSVRAWLIAEPTPPDLEDDEPETESVTAPPPGTQAPTEGKDETAPSTQETKPTRPGNENKPGQEKPEQRLKLWHVLRWLLLAALLWFAIVFQRLLRIFLRRRRMTGGPNRRALGLWQDVERISAVLDQEPPEELLMLAQKARFSQHKLNKEELRRFSAWLKDSRRMLQRRPLWQRLWMQYILALW